MKSKMCWWKKALWVIAVLFLLVIIIATILFWMVIRTVASYNK